MTLFEKYLLSLFKWRYTGKDNAIKIRDLFTVVSYDYKTEHRKMRQGYEGLAVCSSPNGLYLLETEDERREQIALRMKLIYAHFKKIRVLREYKIESDSVQKNLF